jgi:hypothetical protein
MLAWVRHEAKRLFGDWPLHVLPPTRPPDVIDFPRVRFTALFRSFPVRQDMHQSALVIVWFQEQQFPALNEASLAALQAVEWERLAVDFET